MNTRNILKSWKTSLIGLFCLAVAGYYAVFVEGARWEIVIIFLVASLLLFLSPDKLKKAVDKAMDKVDAQKIIGGSSVPPDKDEK